MKTIASLIFLGTIFAAPVRAEEKAQIFAIQHAGVAFEYVHFVTFYTGGPAQHIFLLWEKSSKLEVPHFEGPEDPPYVPYITLGGVRFPIAQAGIYLLTRESDRVDLRILLLGSPMVPTVPALAAERELMGTAGMWDREAIEVLLREILDRHSDRLKLKPNPELLGPPAATRSFPVI